MHPGQIFFNNAGEVLIIGCVIGVCSYIFSMPIYENTIIGLDAYFVLNAFSFYHVRHSHINMSYGWLEKWIMSPAQHQLHHSREARHWDKNFGLFLSVWDLWFGTLAYSEPRGSFQVGLPGGEGEEYRTLVQLYTTPFIKIWNMAQTGWQSKLPAGPHNGDVEAAHE
jgi:sterol desaturase/sphingolipid hydroxylase (fatty acid hydroxylase superfamily)